MKEERIVDVLYILIAGTLLVLQLYRVGRLLKLLKLQILFRDLDTFLVLEYCLDIDLVMFDFEYEAQQDLIVLLILATIQDELRSEFL